jgi:transcription-repair coupling factor (superfamily II helicase)
MTDLLDLVADSAPIADKLRRIDSATRKPVVFSHVLAPAQAFLASVIAGRTNRTIWAFCPTVRSQELFYEGVLNWMPNAQFLPEAEFAAVENVLPDPEIAAERLALLGKMDTDIGPTLIIATRASLDHPAPKRGALRTGSIAVARGQSLQMEALLEQLVKAGYERASQTTTRGQFAVRGGIVDLYSWQAQLPVRIEFFGDNIESLREFDIDTQTSVRDLKRIDILLGAADDQSGKVRDYIDANHLIIEVESDDRVSSNLSAPHIEISEGWIEEGPEDFSGAFQDCDVGEFGAGDLVLAEAKRAQFVGRLNEWRKDKFRVAIYFQTEGEIERFREIVGDAALENVDLVEGALSRGFCFPAGKLVLRHTRAANCEEPSVIAPRSISAN